MRVVFQVWVVHEAGGRQRSVRATGGVGKEGGRARLCVAGKDGQERR